MKAIRGSRRRTESPMATAAIELAAKDREKIRS